MPEYIRERDVTAAVKRLSFLSTHFRREVFGRSRLDRLERIRRQRISPDELLELIVRDEGYNLLGPQRRIGKSLTSIRKKLLEGLSEGKIRELHRAVRGPTRGKSTSAMVRELSKFKWTRGSANAIRITRALGIPECFAGHKEAPTRSKRYEVAPLGRVPPLKPYQRGIIAELHRRLEDNRRVMVSCFTGTGKTRMALEYVISTLLGEEEAQVVLWVAQKRELLDQTCDAIDELWPSRSEASGSTLSVYRFLEGSKFQPELPSQPVFVVATSHQVVARLENGDPFLEKVLCSSRLLVIDEAHHALAPGHKKIIDHYRGFRNPIRVLGLTATPGRSNILDPTESQALADLFDRTLIVPDVPSSALEWFQREGYLSRLEQRRADAESQVAQKMAKHGFASVDDSRGEREFTTEFLKVVGSDSRRNRAILMELERQYHEGRHILVFCCNIAQAQILFQSSILRGIPGGVIHHRIDRRDRRNTIVKFRSGEIRILFNVEVLTTGFDAPKVDTVVMCRPTLSRILYEQMIGRGLRGPQMGGTESCRIVDFTTNFGVYSEPQAWEAFWREWGLEPAKPKLPSPWHIHEAKPLEIEDEAFLEQMKRKGVPTNVDGARREQ